MTDGWTLPSGHPSQVKAGSEKPVKAPKVKETPKPVETDGELSPGPGGGDATVTTPTVPDTTPTTGANSNEG